MKKLLNSHKKKIIAAISLLLIATVFVIYYRPNPLRSNNECVRSGYNIYKGEVFYCIFRHDYFKIKDADSKTFEAISVNYAKDKNNVYVANYKIPDADSKTFEVLSFNYSKDKYIVYDFTKKITGADPETFEPLSYIYAKDKNSVYIEGEKLLLDVDAETFEVLPGGYTKDKNNFYKDEEIVDDLPDFLKHLK